MTDTQVAPAVSDPPQPIRSRWPWLAAGVVLAAAAGWSVLWTGLNHDVRRTLGVLKVSTFPASDVFAQRPLAHRLPMGALEALSPGGWRLGDAAARLIAIVCVVGAAALLYRGLARWVDRREALGVAGAVGVALALAPPWDFLQPEWVACVLTVAGTGAGLLRRLPVAVLAGGGLLALAALQKYVTLSMAVLGLIVIFVLNRRRALAVATGCAGLGIAGFALSLVIAPREWLWFKEMGDFNPASPLRPGGDVGAAVRVVVDALATELVVAPLLALAPAAVILLARLSGRAWVGWSILTVLIAVAPALVQAQGFGYHLAALPVLAAGLWALATVRWTAAAGGRSWLLALGIPTGAIVAATALMLTRSVTWRSEHGGLVLGSVTVAAALAACWAAFAPRRAGSGWWPAPAAGLLVACAVAVPALPTSAYAVGGYSGGYVNSAMRDYTIKRMDAYTPARTRIGPTTPVIYTVYADDAYLFGNPSPCRYPQPSWLMAAVDLPKLREARSYQENLDCLFSTDAKYLVIYPYFFARTDPQLGARVRERFDCDQAIPAFDVLLCPIR